MAPTRSRHRLWKEAAVGTPGTLLCSVLPQIRPGPPANPVGSSTLVLKKANRVLFEKHRLQMSGFAVFSPVITTQHRVTCIDDGQSARCGTNMYIVLSRLALLTEEHTVL